MENLIVPPLDFTENILSYYQKMGLCPYVCLNPFVKLPPDIPLNEYRSSNKYNDILYFYIKDKNNFISWKNIVKSLNFPSISYLNEVMMAGDNSIARSRRFDYQQLKKDYARLGLFLLENNITNLIERDFPIEYEVVFLKSFVHMGYKKVVFIDTMSLDTEEVDLESKINFLLENKTYLCDNRSICSPDFKMAYTVHWDCFFTVLLAAEKSVLHQIVSTYQFEGFYPDENTTYLL